MSDDARAVAFNPAAPADERADALGELQKAHMPTTSALLPPAHIQAVIDHITAGYEEADMLMKANGQIIPFPGRNKPPPKEGMRSVRLDDMQVMSQGEYYEKQSGLNFDALRDMVLATPLLSGIVNTRIRQVSRFCQPSEDGGIGFTVRHEDKKHKLTGHDASVAKDLTKFFKNCGWEFNPRKRKALKRDSLTQFMAKSVWDTLSLDSAPIETEMRRARDAGMDGFYAPDGTTIRLCTEDGYEGDDSIFALQVVQGRVATTYTHEQLIYEPRNPRSDVRMAGYGMAEPELLIKIVTGWLNALTYNNQGFDQNAIPKGLLHLSGNYSDSDVVAFKRYWNMMVKGINNAWALPVLVSKDQDSKASFEKFGVDFDEMMFSKWMTLLTSIACSIYGIAPEEINFESFSAGKSTLSGSDTESKIEDSKDKGFRPLMSYYEAVFTDFVVSEFDENLCFRWVGLDEEDPKQKWEEDKLALTWGELRMRRGDEPLKDPTFESMPLNPSFIGPWQAKMQAAAAPGQPQQAGPDYGQDPDEEGQGGPADGSAEPADTEDATATANAEGAAVDAGATDAGTVDPTGGAGGGDDFGKALAGAVWAIGGE